MDDRLRETLSAMMDDEADELSVRRLLSHESQDEVRAQWQRWQDVRDLMHDGHSPAHGMDVSLAVRELLDGRGSGTSRPEPAVQANKAGRWHWPAAAMVAMALLVGFGAGAGWDSSGPGPVQPVTAAAPETPVQNQPVREIALQGLDEEQWEYMSRYLLEHAQHNSVGAGRGAVGYARLVSANGAGY
ncbi:MULTISPECIES: sigma-E factor negative regulatory protein [Marinobacter]|jgi:sigma-E factor negative regulatory protein RseA|uniref:sigma-E factor negative regulatory protein n=1 Tax=Marinobacter TaxID=2742 RepID=UPI0007D9EEB7|nr:MULTISPECIES: sigma-E factor negative regulatory protein [unclassified Marinobacter]MBL3824864.1 sigma-E factor negative regulatory protein [Marinobacter sp. MC3]MBL3893370.1 sigma-E factor negative regulatory protein [Marinobacter sp. MW3]OAN93847.1 anti-sigma factor [Marinobacter sp. EhC06]OAN94556.1 anti-sigma factor [Marinobacter sp. EhN04]